MKNFLADKRVIVVSLIVIFILLLMDFNQRMVLLTKLRSQEKQLTQKYAQLESTLTALETEIADAVTDQAVEKWAREEAGMIREGDIPIVLLPPSEPPVAEIGQQTVVIERVDKWEIWQELFFGD